MMAPNETSLDFVRHLVLHLLMSGPQDLEYIKKTVLHIMSYRLDEAGVITIAGRSQFDAMVWAVMSSLCNAGLAESVKIRRFCITEDGRKAFRAHVNFISAEDLKKVSKDYRRLTSRPDPAKAAPAPERAQVRCREGIVAMIDMLGTREPHNESRTADMHNNWNTLLTYAMHLVKKERGPHGCKISAFSDTMFVTAEGDGRVLLGAFGRVGIRLIPKSIELGTPIRGCVATGRFYQSGRRLFTGPAVREAATYYERPQWVGISTCPSAYGKIGGLGGARACYTKYDMPLKRSVEYDALVVNWPDCYNHEHVDKEGDLDEMLSILDRRMEEAPDVDASFKWRNTRDFLCMATGTEGRPARP